MKNVILCLIIVINFVFTFAAISEDKLSATPTPAKVEEKFDETPYKSAHLGELLNKPESFIGQQIKFRGEFSSFVTLALDYKPAYRSSKDFLSFTIFRPSTKIPLSELKLAYPIEKAKDNKMLAELEKGDLIEVYGKVFNAALGEPWVDVLYIKKLKSAPNSKTVKSKKDS